jgi:hypothetical protein
VHTDVQLEVPKRHFYSDMPVAVTPENCIVPSFAETSSFLLGKIGPIERNALIQPEVFFLFFNISFLKKLITLHLP